MHDPVDIALGRHLDATDADEGIAEWLADQQIKEEASAQAALANPASWEWESTTHALTNTSKVPYTVEEVLIEALDRNHEARAAYAELMAGPAAAKLRQLLAEHWANEMWETRSSCEISAAIAAEKEALND